MKVRNPKSKRALTGRFGWRTSFPKIAKVF